LPDQAWGGELAMATRDDLLLLVGVVDAGKVLDILAIHRC
jgi:hypothetical protein